MSSRPCSRTSRADQHTAPQRTCYVHLRTRPARCNHLQTTCLEDIMLLRNLALATTLAVGAPAAAFAAPEAPAAVETVKVKAPQASPSDATNYAEREKQDQKASSFQG